MRKRTRPAAEPRSFAAHSARGAEDPQVDGANLREEHKQSRGLRFGSLRDTRLIDWSVEER